jgi:hypothetical protein
VEESLFCRGLLVRVGLLSFRCRECEEDDDSCEPTDGQIDVETTGRLVHCRIADLER